MAPANTAGQEILRSYESLADPDTFIPVAHAHAAHAAIPSSRLEILAGVGHYPHCEAPARFVEVLFEFIDSTPPARVSEREWRLLFHTKT